MNKFSLLPVTLLFLFLSAPGAQEQNLPQQPKGGKALITRLEGKASFSLKDSQTPQPLEKGDSLRMDSQIRTETNARLDAVMTGNRHIRLDERTTIALVSSPNGKGEKGLTLSMVTGNIWIYLPKEAGNKGGISILTANAVIQSDKGVFRLAALPDKTVLVKVYSGTVRVTEKKNTARNTRASRNSKQWGHILKAMDQILIRPAGTSTNPFRFMVKPDRNSWVLWNQSLDKEIGN